MIKRTRPRSNAMRTNTNKPQQNGSFTAVADDRQELRLKPRNHYQQQLDKYSNMARESLRSGDRVDAEIHFQYAEHYLRQLNERIRHDNEQQQQQAQRQQQRDLERNERMKQQPQRQQQHQKHVTVEQDDAMESSNTNEHETVQDAPSANGLAAEGEPKQTNRRARPYFRRTRTTSADDSAPISQPASHSSETA